MGGDSLGLPGPWLAGWGVASMSDQAPVRRRKLRVPYYDGLEHGCKVLTERYAEYGLVGFLRGDGLVTLCPRLSVPDHVKRTRSYLIGATGW